MKTKFLIIFLAVITLFYFCQSSFARHNFIHAEQIQNRDEQSTIIKNKIEENFKKVSSFIADLEVKEYTGENIKGIIFYKSTPDKMKITLEFPNGEKIIKYNNEGSEIMYLPNKNIAIKKISSKDFLSISSIVDYINADDAEVTQDNYFYYYKIKMPLPDNSVITDEIPVIMKTYINKKYYYTEKIIFINQGGEELETQEFKNYQLNIPIEDKEFEFVPPKDCQIMFQTEVSTDKTKQQRRF